MVLTTKLYLRDEVPPERAAPRKRQTSRTPWFPVADLPSTDLVSTDIVSGSCPSHVIGYGVYTLQSLFLLIL